MARAPGLLRERSGSHAQVGYAELLFDLVFVYAVTQLSHALLDDPTAGGALGTGLLFLATWWVWNYTAWVTNWLDPEKAGVQLMLFAMMAAGLILSISIPHAFESAAIPFAFAYVAMQVGRSLFMWAALRVHSPDNAMNFARIACWFALSACFWVAGAFAGHDGRAALWTAAVLIELAAPLAGFRVPGLGRSRTETWNVESGHLAERCALFIIIAFGETILMTGASFAAGRMATDEILTFIATFVATLAMWRLYFASVARRAGARFGAATNVGAMARSAYTYLHVPIVAGIILFAAGVNQLIVHAADQTSVAGVAFIAGGPLVYVVGLWGFRAATGLPGGAAHAAIALLLAIIIAASPWLTPFVLAALVGGCVIALAAWDQQVPSGRPKMPPART